MTTHYSSHTQPRRMTGRTHPPLPPLSTLPRSSSHFIDHSSGARTIGHHGRQVYSTSNATPVLRTPPAAEGDYAITKRILSTAAKTGSTRDLRLLLNDALALTEKLDSVSATVGQGRSSFDRQRLSSGSVFVKSPGAYSETGSMFRSQSLENGLDLDTPPADGPRYETSASFAAAMATPVRKTGGYTFQNGHTNPPSPSSTSSPPSASTLPSRRRGSPLLNDSRSNSSGDYTPKSSVGSRTLSRNKSESVGDESPHTGTAREPPHTEPPHTGAAREFPQTGNLESQSDSVDDGLDCIAQLEALEKELLSYKPAQSPQRNSRESHDHGNGSHDASQESHYEVDPFYARTKKEKVVPPSERVGGGRPTMKDFVDELTEVEHQVSKESGEDSHTRGMTSSTATRELDELMADLSKFEPVSGKTDQSQSSRDSGKVKSTAMDNLNSMLGSLDDDMTKRHGVKTAPKGMCAACNKPILTKVVNALGCQWHREHFTCAQCDTELASTTYYESNGRPYCEKDYHELYAPRCAYCNGPILERVLRALDKTWHKEHFFCTLCGKDFGQEGFHERDGKAFCRECYYEKFAPRCKRCEKAIMEGFITALNSQWHPECFCCKVCKVTFPRGNYFDHEGEPHCEIHYHASRGTLCASCQKPVTGKCITAMGRKWHPEHFTCAFCLKLLNKGTFKEHRHNPYCQPCFIKLFG